MSGRRSPLELHHIRPRGSPNCEFLVANVCRETLAFRCALEISPLYTHELATEVLSIQSH